MSRTTLKDVGNHIGVSAKTVSNVVNDTGFVRDELKLRVRRAIAELGYRPNAAARQLRSGYSGMIALAVPDLAQPYFAELASAIVRAADLRSLTVLISQTNGQADVERRISEGVGVPMVDGLMLSALALSAEDLANRSDTTPIVLLGEHIGSSPLPHVAIDNVAAACAATEHLLQTGRRRIAAIGAKLTTPREAADLRLEGYLLALRTASIPIDQQLICVVSDYERIAGVAAADALIDGGVDFDAVFAFNDSLALGVLHALLKRGIRVPEEVSIIGFDDIEEGRYSAPALTSISPDKHAIARAALDVLQDKGLEARGGQPPFEVPVIPFQLVQRAST